MVYIYLYAATPCNILIPLLNYNYDANISAASFMPHDYYNFTPSQARMSGDGWCAQSMCRGGSDRQYLQVDFGAEVVVEAISIRHVDSRSYHYITEYYVEYGSNDSQFHCVISKDSNTSVSLCKLAITLSY